MSEQGTYLGLVVRVGGKFLTLEARPAKDVECAARFGTPTQADEHLLKSAFDTGKRPKDPTLCRLYRVTEPGEERWDTPLDDDFDHREDRKFRLFDVATDVVSRTGPWSKVEKGAFVTLAYGSAAQLEVLRKTDPETRLVAEPIEIDPETGEVR